jgi:hypothetical protein
MERRDPGKGDRNTEVGALRGALEALSATARFPRLAEMIRARAAIGREGARRHVQVFQDPRRH